MDGPPRKKARIAFVPDGFNTAPTTKPRSKVQIPRREIISEFEEPLVKRNTTSVSKVVAPQFVSGFGDAEPSCLPKPTSKASVRSSNLFRLHGAHQGRQLAAAQKPKSVRALNPPVLAPTPGPSDRDRTPARKVDELGFPLLALPQSQAEPSTPPRHRRPLVVPPSLAGPSRVDTVKMKTISTTAFARATDITTEDGPANLFSILLQGEKSTFVDPSDRELYRGLGQSPEKASKSKEQPSKYISGGLAHRARGLFARNERLDTLWRQWRTKETPIPDLRLRILSVAYAAPLAVHRRGPTPPPTALVRCRSISKSGEEYLSVVLYFDNPPNPLSRLNKIEDLKNGGEIHVQKRWLTMQTDGAHDVLRDLPNAPMGDLPPVEDVDWNKGRVLLCSRFSIVPPTNM